MKIRGTEAREPPPPKTQPLKVLPAQTVMRIIGERRWMRRMPRGARSASPQQPPKIPHPVPPPRTPTCQGSTGGGLRGAAGRCCSLCLRNLRAAASLLSAGAAGSAMQPLAAPSRGGGEGGRGQMSQQPPPAWGGQMGWRGMGRGGGWRDRRMGREGGWRRPTCRSTARPSRPSHGLQTAAAALPADEAAGCPVPPRLWVSVGGPGGPMSPERLCSTSGRGAADGFLPCFLVQEEMLRWKGAARRAGGCFQPE